VTASDMILVADGNKKSHEELIVIVV